MWDNISGKKTWLFLQKDDKAWHINLSVKDKETDWLIHSSLLWTKFFLAHYGHKLSLMFQW